MSIETICRFNALAHNTDNDKCWCNPELRQPCPEAECDCCACPANCWRCGGRGVVDVYANDVPLIIIHRDL